MRTPQTPIAASLILLLTALSCASPSRDPASPRGRRGASPPPASGALPPSDTPLWTCRIPGANAPALIVANTSAPGEFSAHLWIYDSRVCGALNVGGGADGIASAPGGACYFGLARFNSTAFSSAPFNPPNTWVATQGDGLPWVLFFGNSGGITVESRPSRAQGPNDVRGNYFFPPGQCSSS